MYLKRLDIVGFKSFADTIKLDFEPGITAVVGPNGCGKSNIIDAIRWCLGEMSAKSLRSSMMMDVVFNGSGSRPPQNMAEVSLTFDNTDKRLPIDFSEVSISRRLFRSGESEYFINKTQCRLRDIKELFLDTGMGEDGYSSLEQGKVEWVLQAKPEERRELFEEAAGVSKYRARREEALRKLERVEIDLSRLADIVSVTNDQIRKLENAVNKAKTYQRIREELKTLEISDWLFQLSDFETQVSALQQTLADAQVKAEELNTLVHQTDSQVSEHRLQLTQLEEELLKANSYLNSIETDLKIAEERQNNAKQREEELKNQITVTEQTIQQETNRISELQVQKESQLAALEQIKSQGDAIESEFGDSQKSHQTTLANLETKKNEVKNARDLILDRAQERSRLQQQIGHLSSDAARFQSRAENFQKDRERSQIQIDELTKSHESLNQHKVDLDGQLILKKENVDKNAAQISQLTAEEDRLQDSLMHCAESIAKLQGQIHSIREQQTQDPYLSGAQAILSAGLSGIQGPLGRLIQSSDSDRDLIASTIGEHLGDLIANTASDAQQAIDYLKTNQKGRARIWILEKFANTSSDYLTTPSSGEPLLSRITCDSSIRPLVASLCGSALLDGHTIYGKAFINGGADPSKWKSHVTLRLPELEKSLEEKEVEKISLQKQAAEHESMLQTAAKEKEVAVKEIEEVRIRLELTSTELQKLHQKIQVTQEEQQLIEIELAQIQDDKVKAQRSHEECMGRFNLLQSQEKDDHDQLDMYQQELTELQQTHAKSTADLAAKEEKHKAFIEKLNWHTSLVQHTDQESNSISSRLQHHSAQMNQLRAQIEASKSSQAEAAQLIESSLQKRVEAAEQCSGIQVQRTQIVEKVSTLEQQLSVARKSQHEVQEQIQTALIQETNLKNHRESLEMKLKDQYELGWEDAKVQFAPQAADAETLDRLKKRVANMGPINLAAPQEHQELVDKNTFLTTQQADLLKAKDDLKQVIQKINATTREHFKETFEKVRENFRTLYSKLFQGGEADLRFTDEADILNTGIDIFCQPPGKKLLHISLLSGGEKALTAIALLFAFFQVRPSPIALMDEVDAPLDEANVLRYVDMIKVFSENSQFILISHNKRTMEAANSLYGVTMEELGVSKVLSARLQKAPEAPAKPREATTATA